MVQVESEAIHEISFDKSRSTLHVRFAHGGWYRYFGVPAEIYNAFVAADSHGRFFHDHIRDHFPYSRGP